MKPTRATAFKFLKAHSVAVIGTVSNQGKPSTTPVTYFVTVQNNLRFVTRDQTTKHRDITEVGSVAVTVVDSKQPTAVNLTGFARLVEDPTELRSSFRKIGKLNKTGDDPPAIKHQLGNLVMIEVVVERIQYTDYTAGIKSNNIFNL